MNKDQYLALVKLNLIKSYSSNLTNDRRKMAKGQQESFVSILPKIIINFFIGLIIMVVLYFFLVGFNSLAGLPGYFNLSLILFSGYLITVAMQSIYAIFYDNQDTEMVMAMPFSKAAIINAKFTSLIISIFPFVVTIFMLFIYLALGTESIRIISLLLALISATIVTFVLIVTTMVVTHLVILLFKNFIRPQVIFTILFILMLFAFIGIYGYFLSINADQFELMLQIGSLALQDYQGAPEIFTGLYNWVLHPGQLSAWLSGGFWIILAAVAYLIYRKWYIPNALFSSPESMQGKTKANYKIKSVTSFLRKYNRSLIGDTQILLTIFMGVILPPLILGSFFIPFIMDSNVNLQAVPFSWFGAIIIFGFLYAYFSQDTYIAHYIVSLDKDNYHYIQALPISKKYYLKQKLNFARLIDISVPTILLIITMFLVGLPLWLIVTFMTSFIIWSLIYSEKALIKDYNHLYLDWSTTQELLMRGDSPFIQALKFLGKMLLTITIPMITSLAYFLIPELGRQIASITIFVMFILIIAFWYQRQQKRFWKKLD